MLLAITVLPEVQVVQVCLPHKFERLNICSEIHKIELFNKVCFIFPNFGALALVIFWKDCSHLFFWIICLQIIFSYVGTATFKIPSGHDEMGIQGLGIQELNSAR